MIKAILFDFDGVIVESMDIKTKAFTNLFSDYPECLDQIVKLHTDNGGMSRFEKFKIIYRDMLRKPLSRKKMELLNKRFSKYVYDKVLECPYVAGAYEFLSKYYKQCRFFIVSGTPDEEIKSIVRERGLMPFFVNVYGAPPDKTALISKILRHYNLKPGQTLFVGDAINDYEGAKNTNVGFVARIKKGCPNPFLELKIEGIIEDLFGLQRFLNQSVSGEHK